MTTLTYNDVKIGDIIFSPIPGIPWHSLQSVVIDKQPPNTITLRERQMVHVVSQEWFDNAGFLPVTNELIAKEPPQ